MKVLYVCPLAHLGGHPYHESQTEVSALKQKGVEVHFLTFAGLMTDKNSKVRFLQWANRKKALSFLFRSLAFYWTIGLTFWLPDYDLIYLRDGIGPSMSFPQLFSGRWIVSVLTDEKYPGLGGRMIRLTKCRWLYSKTKNRFAYACQNESLVDYYSNGFIDGELKGKVFLLPPSVKSLETKYKAIQDGHTLLWFGPPHRGKDLQLVEDALKGSSISFIKGGMDGQLPEDEKPGYFSRATFAILSYRSSFTGTASMLQECCRFGVPVIASDNQQLGELVKKYEIGLVFKAGDKVSLISSLQKAFLMGEEERQVMVKNCAKFCEDYSPAKWAERFIQIYSEAFP